MRERINAFLSNESSFGKLMTKLGIIIGANLMFALFSLPVFTVGAADRSGTEQRILSCR